MALGNPNDDEQAAGLPGDTTEDADGNAESSSSEPSNQESAPSSETQASTGGYVPGPGTDQDPTGPQGDPSTGDADDGVESDGSAGESPAREPGSGGGGVVSRPGDTSQEPADPQGDAPADSDSETGEQSASESQERDSREDVGGERDSENQTTGSGTRERIESALGEGAQAANVEQLSDRAYRVETDPTAGSGVSPGPGAGGVRFVATSDSGMEFLESMAERRSQYADVGEEMIETAIEHERIEAVDQADTSPSTGSGTPEGQVATGDEAIENATGNTNQPAPDDVDVSVEETQTQPAGQSTVSTGLGRLGQGRGTQGPVENLLSASRDASQILTQGVVMPTAAGAGEAADLTADVLTIPTDVATGQGVEVSTEGSGVAEDFTEDAVQGAGQVGTSLTVGAPLTVQSVGETAIDAGQFAVENPTEVPGATADVATDYAEQTIETAQHRPGLLAGQFAAGFGVGGAVSRGIAGTRLMTGRTGQAISTASRLDPGANAIRLGKRGISGVRSRAGSGSGSGSAGTIAGRTSPGTGGTGSLFDADSVDAARGVTGPSRTARIRGRIERSGVADQIRSFRSDVQTFLDDTRAQQNLLSRGESRRGSDGDGQLDVDESDVPSDYEPSRDDILEGSPRDRISDDITERAQTDVRGAAGDFEGSPPAFRDTDAATQSVDVDVESYENLYGSPGQRELTDIQGDLRSMAFREGRGGRAEPIVDDPVGVADDSAVFPRQRAVADGDAAVDAASVVDDATADAASVTGVSVQTGGVAALLEAQQPQVSSDATTPDGVSEQAQTSTLAVDTGSVFSGLFTSEAGVSDTIERIEAAERMSLDEIGVSDEASNVASDSQSDTDVTTGGDTDTGNDTETGVDVTVGTGTATDTDTSVGTDTGVGTTPTQDQGTGTETTPGETTRPVQEPGTPEETTMPPEDTRPPQQPGEPRTPLTPDSPGGPGGGPPARPDEPPRTRPRPRPDLPEDNEDMLAGVDNVDLDVDEKTFEYDVATPSEVADGLDDAGDLDDDTALDIDADTDVDLDLDI